MAESVLKSMASEHGLTDWYVDSAALREWNVGRGPEERALAVLAEHGLTSDHVGRLIGADDFRQFDYVFGMDESNVADLLHRAPVDGRAKIELLGNYRGKELDRIIIDPYFVSGKRPSTRHTVATVTHVKLIHFVHLSPPRNTAYMGFGGASIRS